MLNGDPEFIDAIAHANGREICTGCITVTCVQSGDSILIADKGWNIIKKISGRVEECVSGDFKPECK
ncbi:MAG: hypothetical protein DRI61_17475 [Chloroflexi bacterium]|nr:MAG: hypothetical protein DRI61_17475 [Chloroflexota bacterium]